MIGSLIGTWPHCAPRSMNDIPDSPDGRRLVLVTDATERFNLDAHSKRVA